MMNPIQIRSRPELHLISSGRTPISELLKVSAAVLPYVDYIHLRDKQLPANMQYEAVQEMRRAGVPVASIVVNDRLDVALAAGAGGVQLAGHSLPAAAVRPIATGIRLGCSVHSPEEAAAAAGEGADYCLFGHVYDSSSKPGFPGRGLVQLAEAVQACSVPVIAIGGIEPGNAGDVIRSGAHGIAVLSGIWHSPDPAGQARAYRSAMDTAWLERG
ncbi:thiamine phosphate synthase [Paenibacillus tengchongensis]|uniref:thiamine phosphate synthase n=1 Tax=Paenibacillus tengchongensis TaxID=2608684 RepID=UPI0016523CA6|nr:thiamine phosphate synthase [Paenibacillus tengchongensis]